MNRRDSRVIGPGICQIPSDMRNRFPDWEGGNYFLIKPMKGDFLLSKRWKEMQNFVPMHRLFSHLGLGGSLSDDSGAVFIRQRALVSRVRCNDTVRWGILQRGESNILDLSIFQYKKSIVFFYMNQSDLLKRFDKIRT